jgi:hypothetical protein
LSASKSDRQCRTRRRTAPNGKAAAPLCAVNGPFFCGRPEFGAGRQQSPLCGIRADRRQRRARTRPLNSSLWLLLRSRDPLFLAGVQDVDASCRVKRELKYCSAAASMRSRLWWYGARTCPTWKPYRSLSRMAANTFFTAQSRFLVSHTPAPFHVASRRPWAKDSVSQAARWERDAPKTSRP